MRRCCGPEAHCEFREPWEVFEPRVAALVEALNRGESLPPLVLQFARGGWTLSDGNHRHEALVRAGRTSWPSVVWTTGTDAADFEALWGPWVTVDRSYREGRALGREGVVGCLVVDPAGRVFAQKRSADRKTFPGCWDLVGGHVEDGETPYEALVRELVEETGWELDRVLGLRKVVDWEVPSPTGPRRKREFVLAVTIRSGWDSPRLEAGKVTEGRWFGPGDLTVLSEGRGSDTYVHDLVSAEFALGASPQGRR